MRFTRVLFCVLLLSFSSAVFAQPAAANRRHYGDQGMTASGECGLWLMGGVLVAALALVLHHDKIDQALKSQPEQETEVPAQVESGAISQVESAR